MNQPLTSILDKVRKLRALAQSSNVHEAAAAAAAAERLIQENSLSEAALHVEGEAEEILSDDGVGVAEVGKQIPQWMKILVGCLSRAYQCTGLWRYGAAGYTFTIYGRASDVGTFRYQAAFFAAEITRLTEQSAKGRGRTYANNFRLGAVVAIREALDGARKAARAQAVSSALVVVDRRAELAKEKRDEMNPNQHTVRGSVSRYDANAFAAGKRAGASISNQSAKLSTSGARMLGKGGS